MRLQEAVREKAILAPQQGVTRDPQGRATARAIGGFWLVDSGLEAGDRLIVSSLQKVKKPGDAAKPVKADIALTPSPRPHAADKDGSKTSLAAEGGDGQ